MSTSTLPGSDALDRIVECTGDGVFLDLTNWTGGTSLPNCVTSCPSTAEAIDYNANGDRYSCVEPESYNKTRLRFSLSSYCQASSCRFADDWDLYRQVVTVKVAELLSISLGELRSAILYWKVDSIPPPSSSPTLSSFFVARSDEDDFVAAGSRRLTRHLRRRVSSDPWYLIYFAFRGETQRLGPNNLGLELLNNSTESDLLTVLGVPATVSSLEWIPFADSSVSTAWSPSDFSAVYQFDGYDPNTAPGEALELGGAAREAELAECQEACYTYNEVVDSSRCSNDCQCNGQRWCSHVGECTGEMPPCRTDGVETRTITTTKTTTKGPVTTTSQGTTKTTTFSPLAELSSACAALVEETWRPCQIGSEVDACPGIACAVTSTLLSASSCEADLCPNGASFTSVVATDYWNDLCENSAVNLEYTQARHNCYPTYTSTTTTTTIASPTAAAADAAGSLLPLLWISLIFCGCCCCLCIGRLLTSSRVLMFFHDWWDARKHGNSDVRVLAPPSTSFKGGKRPPSSHRPGPGPTVVRASTVKSQKEAAKHRSKWFGIRRIPLVGSKVPTVPAEAEDVPFGYAESGSFASTTRGARESTTSSSESENSAHARSAWESGGGNNEGPRKAGNAEGAALSPAAEALLGELRRLRGAEHSAAERKRYFREQMLKWHPDKNIGEEEKASEMFKALQDSKGWFLNED